MATFWNNVILSSSSNVLITEGNQHGSAHKSLLLSTVSLRMRRLELGGLNLHQCKFSFLQKISLLLLLLLLLLLSIYL